jgi:membrane associated rhomboid family serine protease
MIFPVRTDSPLRSTPWMNWTLIAVTVICHIAQRRLAMRGMDVQLFLNSSDPQLFQYFTYTFLHGDWGHLLGNMLFLYSGIGHLLTPDSGPVIGASGAVSAVTGAYLVLFPRSNITVIYFFILIGSFEMPSMYFIIFFFIKDLVPIFSGAQSGIAHMAHVAGTIFGVGVCISLLAVYLLPRDQFDVLALMQRWNKRRQYQNLVRAGYDPFSYLPPSGARRGGGGDGKHDPRHPVPVEPLDPAAQQIQDLRAEISESIAHHNLPHAAMLFLKLNQIDSKQVLSRQAQLDVANQLASQQNYTEAVEAYEQFLEHYANFEQIEQVQLMLGLIYARYLNRPDRAREMLVRALARLHNDREIEMARSELERIATITPR